MREAVKIKYFADLGDIPVDNAHADRHALTMAKLKVACSLDRMAEGVPKVEELPLPAFLEIFVNNLLLPLCAALNPFFQFFLAPSLCPLCG